MCLLLISVLENRDVAGLDAEFGQRNPAYTVCAALSHTAQLVSLLAYFLQINLPEILCFRLIPYELFAWSYSWVCRYPSILTHIIYQIEYRIKPRRWCLQWVSCPRPDGDAVHVGRLSPQPQRSLPLLHAVCRSRAAERQMHRPQHTDAAQIRGPRKVRFWSADIHYIIMSSRPIC